MVVNHPELFTPNYIRFLLNRFRETLPFSEVPMRIVIRARRQREDDLTEDGQMRVARGRKGVHERAGSRQSALLSVVEDKDFYAREYNTAYVLIHFFGYLRRNPDDPPDRDLRGLNFWRDSLDLWGDYRSISRAFLESDEYKNSRPQP